MRSLIGIAILILAACASTPPNSPAPRSSPASGPSASASAPATRQLTAWLAVFNAGDRDALVAYHAGHFAYELAGRDLADVDHELGLATRTGGFDLRAVEDAAAHRVVAVLQERRSERRARVVIEVEPAPPHRVRQFAIAPIRDAAPVPRLSEADALAALRANLDDATARDQFAGAVLVARRGIPIFAQAYGYADREHQIRNTLDTHFRIGSMNKMFTAVAALRLAQDGRLALHAPIADVLANYPNPALAAKVTPHHLLSHTGGTGDIFTPEYEARRREIRSLQDYVDLLGARALAFEPGARFAYSNYGFLLLGVLIERVTGQSYYDAVHDLVFAPAGMTATSSPIEGRAAPDRAIPYTQRHPRAPWTSAVDDLPYRATSAGGGDSTVTDLLRFANALAAHKLLDAAHTQLLTTAKTPPQRDRAYAYGFEDATLDGVHCIGHNGGALGQNARLYLCDSGYTVIVLANIDPPAADHIADYLLARLPAQAP